MPFSWLYGKIADVRNSFFERGVFASFDLGAPTVSVGNITVGGTGKTPMVAFVAETLADAGARVAILTRGYGRADERERVLVSDFDGILADAKSAGDEPLELAKKLLGKAIVVADADRVAAAKFAREKFGITAFVLDDGFQHRRAKRDLDILLIDASDPFGGGKPLPFGRLREPLENILRADAVVITRADMSNEIDSLRSTIADMGVGKVFESLNGLESVVPLGDYLAGRDVGKASQHAGGFAFCGLGNPENFFAMLRREGFELKGKKAFTDHRTYTQADVSAVEAEAGESGAEVLLTTAKDAVKLADLKFELPCRVVLARPVLKNEDILRELIRAVLR